MADQFSLPGFESPPILPRRVKPSQAQWPAHGLFFGVLPAPDDLLRIEAVASLLRQRLGTTSAQVEAERLHVTCCDLGSFVEAPPQDLIEGAMTAAAGLALPPFEIVFDRVMRFKGNGALVLLEPEGATPLKAFRDALGQMLVGAGVPVNIVSTPHMTLGYGGDAVSEPLAEPIRWTAVDFVLVDSLVRRHVHLHTGRWPLVSQR